jgi:hypothetical protein
VQTELNALSLQGKELEKLILLVSVQIWILISSLFVEKYSNARTSVRNFVAFLHSFVREEYIPLDVGTDELNKKEHELLKAASDIKETLTHIDVESQRLGEKRVLLTSEMTKLHAHIYNRKLMIDHFNHILEKLKKCVEGQQSIRLRSNPQLIQRKALVPCDEHSLL